MTGKFGLYSKGRCSSHANQQSREILMTNDYMKKIISIKDWNCGRTKYQIKIQSMCTHSTVEGILMKWEETLFICSGCESWKTLKPLSRIFEPSKSSCNKGIISHSVNLQTKCCLTLHLVFTLASTFSSWFYSDA